MTAILRASPVEIRKSMQAATEMARAGIMFIPVPIFAAGHGAATKALVEARMNELAELCEGEAHER